MKRRIVAALLVLMLLMTNGAFSALAVTSESPSPILWYKMDGIVDGKIVNAAGDSLHGVVRGDMKIANGVKDNAVFLDGDGDYIEIPELGPVLQTVEEYTVTAFVSLGQDQYFQRVFDFGIEKNATFMYLSTNNQSAPKKGVGFGIRTNGSVSEQYTAYDTALGTGKWRHLAVSYRDNTLTLYIDGVAVAQNTACTITPSDLPLCVNNYIGRSLYKYNGDPDFYGKIDDFRMYDSALSAQEISAICTLSDEETVDMVARSLEIPYADEVRTHLQLLRECYGATVTWRSDTPTLVDDDGKLHNADLQEATTVVMSATVTKGKASQVAEIPVTVMPPLSNKGLEAFGADEVTLETGLFRQLTEVNASVIDSMSADSILYTFRYAANNFYGASFELKGEPLGGWAAPGTKYSGHFEGHYMSAAALLYAQNGDAALKEKLTSIIDELDAVQATMKTQQEGAPVGYLSAFSETHFDLLEAGQTTQETRVPWYMIHKILQGVLDIYKYTGYEKALGVAERMADWVDWRTGRLSTEQMQAALAHQEYGGMQGVLADLAVVTGKTDYLELSSRFEQRETLIDSLYEGRDNLTKKHGNTYIAKIVGNAANYNVTGDDYHRIVTENFWNMVLEGRTYVTGGNTVGETFPAPHTIAQNLQGNTCETCNVYNMLKLARDLFRWTGSSAYADYYEQALYNQILGSMNAENGEKTYYQKMAPNSFKEFRSNTAGNYCCSGTGLESFAKLQDSIYFHTEDGVYINLFIASTLNWTEQGFVLEQASAFPAENESVLTVKQAPSKELALHIRVPAWSEGGLTLTVNGRRESITADADGYAVIKRVWSAGDVVKITMNMALAAEATTDNEKVFAFTYGPIVLAGSGTQADGGKFYTDESQSVALASLITFTDPETLEASVTMEGGTAVTLKPFYRIGAEEPYTVYWTMAEPALPEFKTNLSLNKTVSADEIYSATYNASKAVDGNTVTRWCVKSGSENHWLKVDLGDNYYISSIKTMFQKVGDYRFKLWYSEDGEDWTLFADQSASTNLQTHTHSGNGYGRYVKFEYLKNAVTGGGWCSLWEFEVYGAKLSQVVEPTVTGYVNEEIRLPANTEVSFDDGQHYMAKISWDENTKTVYDAEGSYTISGVLSNLGGNVSVTAKVEIGKRNVAVIGDTPYDTVAEALDAAVSGDVIKLIEDTSVDSAVVDEGIVLDLNAHTLQARYLVGFKGSAVIDSADGGRLVIDQDKLALDQTNGGYLPVYDGEGYIFTTVKLENRAKLFDEKHYAFSPVFETFAHEALTAGKESSAVRVVIRLRWEDTDNYEAQQDFTYVNKMVKNVISSYNAPGYENNYGRAFSATFAGSEAGQAEHVSVSAVIISDTGVEIESAVTVFGA